MLCTERTPQLVHYRTRAGEDALCWDRCCRCAQDAPSDLRHRGEALSIHLPPHQHICWTGRGPLGEKEPKLFFSCGHNRRFHSRIATTEQLIQDWAWSPLGRRLGCDDIWLLRCRCHLLQEIVLQLCDLIHSEEGEVTEARVNGGRYRLGTTAAEGKFTTEPIQKRSPDCLCCSWHPCWRCTCQSSLHAADLNTRRIK